MSPTELEEYLFQEPMPNLRLTLSSGDQIVVTAADRPVISGLALVLRGEADGDRLTPRSRMVSVPNIVLVEPVTGRPPLRRRRG